MCVIALLDVKFQQRNVQHGHSYGVSVDFLLQFGDHVSHGFRGARRTGDDIADGRSLQVYERNVIRGGRDVLVGQTDVSSLIPQRRFI